MKVKFRGMGPLRLKKTAEPYPEVDDLLTVSRHFMPEKVADPDELANSGAGKLAWNTKARRGVSSFSEDLLKLAVDWNKERA